MLDSIGLLPREVSVLSFEPGNATPQDRYIEDVRFDDVDLSSAKVRRLTPIRADRVVRRAAEPLAELADRSIGIVRAKELTIVQSGESAYGLRYRASLTDAHGRTINGLRVTCSWFVPWLQQNLREDQADLAWILRGFDAREAYVTVSWGKPFDGVVYAFLAGAFFLGS